MTHPEALWNDPDYQHRIGTLAGRVNRPWPMTCDIADVAEYRAHLVLFRLHNEIEEWIFDEGMEAAAAMEERIQATRKVKRFTPIADYSTGL
jgi:hypothetical protein